MGVIIWAPYEWIPLILIVLWTPLTDGFVDQPQQERGGGGLNFWL
jgi:hypothetical protein